MDQVHNRPAGVRDPRSWNWISAPMREWKMQGRLLLLMMVFLVVTLLLSQCCYVTECWRCYYCWHVTTRLLMVLLLLTVLLTDCWWCYYLIVDCVTTVNSVIHRLLMVLSVDGVDSVTVTVDSVTAVDGVTTQVRTECNNVVWHLSMWLDNTRDWIGMDRNV